jgi:hypothetical protein
VKRRFAQHKEVRTELRAAMNRYESQREGLGSEVIAAVARV